MLTKKFVYKDYNGVEREEEHFFNLNKAEIMEIELSTQGGLSETIKRIIAAQDSPALIKLFKDLIHKAYGVKSPDGKRFIKNDELWAEFEQTEAYSMLFMELATDADAAAKFVNGIVPADLNQQAIAANHPALK